MLETAKAKFPVQILGFCLMPNHSRLVLQSNHMPWSSVRYLQLLGPSQILGSADPAQWHDHPLFDEELATRRTCVKRQQPIGSVDWIATYSARTPRHVLSTRSEAAHFQKFRRSKSSGRPARTNCSLPLLPSDFFIGRLLFMDVAWLFQ